MGLYRRGKVWWVNFTVNGKQVCKTTGNTDKRLAEAWADSFRSECRRGAIDPFAPKGPIPTVAEVLTKYFDVHLKAKNPLSYAASSRYRKAVLLEYFGAETPISKIRPLLDTYKAWRTTERNGKRISLATVKRELTILRAAIRKAVEWQWITFDPMAGYKLPKADNRRERFIEDSEFGRLINASHPTIVPLLIVARHTGMRQGELLNLQWSDLDLIRGWLFVRHSKSGEGRNVPLTSEVIELLSSTPLSERIGFVFKRQGKPLMKGGFLQYQFGKAVRQAGLANLTGPAKFVFHSIRHTFASHAAMRGVDLKTLASILGHKSTRMTERYSHLSDNHRKISVELAAPKRQPITTVFTTKAVKAGQMNPRTEASSEAHLLGTEALLRSAPNGIRTHDFCLERAAS